MGKQAPLSSPPQGGTDCLSRLCQASDPRKRGRSLQLKLSPFATERQLAWQISVGASDVHGEGFGSGQSRLKGEIDQRKIHFRTLVTLSWRWSTTGIPE